MANNLLNIWTDGINLGFTGLHAVISYRKEPHNLKISVSITESK